jgi:uncharacterized membrane protein YccC
MASQAALPRARRTNSSAGNSWNAFVSALTKWEAAKIVPEIAIRNSIGFVAAIAIATVIRSPSAGVIAGTGALNVSYSDSRDPYSLRARRMLVSALLCGAAVTLGSLSGHTNATAILAATLWAFASGMLVALGTTAGDLGVITLVTLVVFAARPLPPIEALQSGLTATGGALLQMALSIALWPVRRYEPERRIIGSLYTALAKMARSPVPPSSAPPFSKQISDAQESLASLGSDHGLEAERLFMLLNQAERIRLSILSLARLVHRIRRYEQGRAVSAALHQVLVTAGDELDAIANCTSAGQAAGDAAHFTEAARAFGGHKWDAPSTFFAALVRDAQQQLDALGGQLRTASGVAKPSEGIDDRTEPWRRRFTGRLAKLQANLSLDSTVFRHALRLALCLGAGDALGRAISLQRTYWIPMTIAIVLKPDFTTTLSRGVLRIVGTLAGLGLATVLFHFIHAGPVTDIALMGIFMFLLRWIGTANYGVFVTALSALVVLLVASTGVAPKDVIVARATNTLLGGLLAIIVYAAWPTWEKTQVGTALADMLEAYRVYFNAVVEALAGKDTRMLDRVRMESRRTRSNAEASVDRLAGEPGVTSAAMHTLQGVLVSSHSFVHAVMALESALYRTQPVPVRPATLRFAEAVDRTLAAAAAGLRIHRELPNDLPLLREAHNRIAGSETAPAARYELVNVETDRIVTSLNTMVEHLREFLDPPVK